MNPTLIEWVKNPDGTQGYTWNPITGCLNGCPYCYARRLANGRLKQRYLANTNTAPVINGGTYHSRVTFGDYRIESDPFYPRFWEDRLGEPIEHPTPMRPAKRKGIFVCDMSELFGDWIPHDWQEQIFTTFKLCPYHRFYLLTKQPQNLIQWSPFPDNCWVGVTATDCEMAYNAYVYLRDISASVKFISFEPLLGGFEEHNARTLLPEILNSLHWLIIGALTGTKADLLKLKSCRPQLTLMPYGKKWTLQPQIEWVEEIVGAADKAGIPVFLKDNLKPLILQHAEDKDAYWADLLLDTGGSLRQEMPERE